MSLRVELSNGLGDEKIRSLSSMSASRVQILCSGACSDYAEVQVGVLIPEKRVLGQATVRTGSFGLLNMEDLLRRATRIAGRRARKTIAREHS